MTDHVVDVACCTCTLLSFCDEASGLLAGLPAFMHDILDTAWDAATYTDQLKAKGRKKKRQESSTPWMAEVDKPTEDLEPEEPPEKVRKTDGDEAVDIADSGAAVPAGVKPSSKKAAKKKPESKKAAQKDKAQPKKASKPKEDPEPPRLSVEDPNSPMCDAGDAAVTAMFTMSIPEIVAAYETLPVPPWATVNNVYSSAYRKATGNAKLTKEQAQLRARAATKMFREGKIVVKKLCLKFSAPRGRRNKKADPEQDHEAPDACEDQNKAMEAEGGATQDSCS